MSREFCLALVLSLSGALSLTVPVAHGQTPPPNDFLSNATVVNSLPFKDTVDIRGATTDSDDVADFHRCFPDTPMYNSVWYLYTPAVDTNFVVDLRDTVFSTGLAIGDVEADGSFGATVCTMDSPQGGRTARKVTAGTPVSILILSQRPVNFTDRLMVSIYSAPTPVNDRLEEARTISSLPFSEEVDPVFATSDADDGPIAEGCGWGVTRHSVWYSFTAGPDDVDMLFQGFDRKYGSNSGIAVATRSSSNWNVIACGSAAVAASLEPGSTYYVLVDGVDPIPFRASHLPPPPTITAQFDDRATVDLSGTALQLSGSYECANASNAFIFGDVLEDTGRRVRRGIPEIIDESSGDVELTCDGARHAFKASAVEDNNGRFTPGRMTAEFSAMACAPGYPCYFSPFVQTPLLVLPSHR